MDKEITSFVFPADANVRYSMPQYLTLLAELHSTSLTRAAHSSVGVGVPMMEVEFSFAMKAAFFHRLDTNIGALSTQVARDVYDGDSGIRDMVALLPEAARWPSSSTLV